MPEPSASSTLRLDCLGSANAYAHGRYWSGFLAGGRALLDCPPQTLPHLVKLGVDLEDLDLLLVSHEHSDHIGGIDLLLLALVASPEGPRRRPFAIAGPPGLYARLRGIVGNSARLPPRDDPTITWFELRGGDSFKWAGAHVEAFEMAHNPDLTALGYRLHLDGRTLAYTGDTKPCAAVERLGEGADLLVAECGAGSATGEARGHHMTWPDILALRDTLDASTRLLVTHYDPRDVPPEAAATPGIELAEDFATYDV